MDKEAENKNYFALLAIVLFGLLAYLKSFWADFQLDDYAGIVENPLIKGANLPALFYYDKTRFITNLTFLLNYSFAGLKVGFWHAVNFSIHAASSFLVFLLTDTLLKTEKLQKQYDEKARYFIAVSVALVFLLHPLQTQAVTYLVQRATTLAGLFYFLTVYFYLRARLENSYRPYRWAITFCFLGMLTKPLCVTLPIVIILLEALFLNQKEKIDFRRWGVFLCFTASLVIVPFFLFGTEKLGQLIADSYQAVPQPSYLFTQFNVITTYLGLFVAPVNQNLDYDFRIAHRFFEFPTIISFLAIVLIIVFAWRMSRKNPLISFGIFWFFVTLLPDSSIFPLTDVINEHRVYLSCYGFALVVCMLVYKLAVKRKTYVAVIAIILVVFSVMTYQRNELWANPLRLMQDVVAKSPNKARPHNNLGFFYFRQGQYDKAKAEYLKTLALDPNYFIARNNLGMIYYEEENLPEAKKIFENLAKTHPNYADAFTGLAMVSQKLGDKDQALQYFKKALQLNPLSSAPCVGLSNIYFDLGYFNEARAMLEKAAYLNSSNASVYYNLGNIYFQENNLYEALVHYQRAVKLRPAFADALNNMGNIFFYFGDFKKAIEEYQASIHYNPSLASAHFNLANALYEVGRIDESRHSAQMAIDLYKAQGQAEKAKSIEQKLKDIPHE